MTRKSKREIDRQLDELEPESDDVHVVEIVRNAVMEREKAKRQGKDIVEDTDSGPDDVDLVVVEKHRTTVEL